MRLLRHRLVAGLRTAERPLARHCIVVAAISVSICALAGCGQSFNRTMFETESARDDPYIVKEYGDGPPAPVTINRQGQSLSFAVRVGRTHPRVLVEGSKEANAAASGTVDRMTLGVLKDSLDSETFREAALAYLASTGKRDCKLTQGGQIGNRFEWTYACGA